MTNNTTIPACFASDSLTPGTVAAKLSNMARTLTDVLPATAVTYLGIRSYGNKSLAIESLFRMMNEAKQLASQTANWKTSQERIDFYHSWQDEFLILQD